MARLCNSATVPPRLDNNQPVLACVPLAKTGAGTVVMAQNFDNAFLRTQPSVSAADRDFYVSMKDRLCKARAHSSEAPPSGGDIEPAASAAHALGGRVPPRRLGDGRGGSEEANGK